jgi:predicted metalloprotease
MRSLIAVLLVLSLGVVAVGCGALDDAQKEGKKQIEKVKKEAKKQIENAKREGKKLAAKADELRKKVAKQVNETLAKIKGELPRADEDTPPVATLRASNSFEDFMDKVLANVNRYWAVTFRAADLRPPRVKRRFIRPGGQASTRCGEAADDQAAFYCPADDTIYFGEGIGKDIYDNIGDFGVAYALAHEYAHNVQQELGWFASGQKLTTVAPFELEADCMAGTWAYAVYQRGDVDEDDLNEAVNTAYAVGDFDLTNPQHHGTPKERSRAWLLGYRSGDPSDCRGFVPT